MKLIEVYGEDIFDLIGEEFNDGPKPPRPRPTTAEKSLRVRDGKVGEDAEVVGACEAKVQSSDKALEYLQRGMKMRRTDHTAMNAESSRSHVIFTLVIQQTHRNTDSQGSTVESRTSKTHFVDLAGSEKIKKSKTQGKRMQEGININKGLFVLGNVISMLGNASKNKNTVVPYRDSKLTRLLKGSLGGNHKTIMIGCVSPSGLNEEETLGTLRYANRAKNIKNNAKVNIDPSSKVINGLKNQVMTLAMELQRLRNSDNFGDTKCPFSEEFLDGLIRASGGTTSELNSSGGTTSELNKPSIASATRSLSIVNASTINLSTIIATKKTTLMKPSSFGSDSIEEYYDVPEELEKLELIDEHIDNNGDNTNMRSRLNDLLAISADELMHKARLGDMTQLYSVRQFSDPEVLENHGESEFGKTDNRMEDARALSIKQSSIYSAIHKSIKDLQVLEDINEEDDVEDDDEDDDEDEDEDGKNQVIRDPRLAWRRSLNKISCAKSSDKESCITEKRVNSESRENRKIQLYDTMLMSLRCIINGTAEAPDANLDRIMKEYKDGYSALKLESEIKLIESKVGSYRNELKFLNGIADQLGKKSRHSAEVRNSITSTEIEMTKLEKELDALLILPR